MNYTMLLLSCYLRVCNCYFRIHVIIVLLIMQMCVVVSLLLFVLERRDLNRTTFRFEDGLILIFSKW